MTTIKSHTLGLTILLFLLTIEISFSQSIALNVYVVTLSLLFLATKKRYGGMVGMILLPLIPALGTFWSIYLYGSDTHQAWLLLSRTFAFAAMGMTFAFGVDLEELLLILEQKKMPTQFVYGILVVLHAVPNIRREIQALKEASLFRGEKLAIWSPMLYLKTILVAFNWRDMYTEAMFSRGFDEEGERRVSVRYETPISSMVVLVGLFVVGHVVMVII